MENMLDSRRNYCELWIVFTPTSRLGRKVSFASDDKETIMISLPVPRTNLPLRTREVYNKSGAASTHDTVYNNVDPLPWGACPKLHRGDKQAILEFDPPLPKSKIFDCTMGVPLYWQEHKDSKILAQILIKDLRGGAIFDASPGSGQLARACLEHGIQYVGVARNQQHAKFLNSMVDRYALALVGKSGSACYEPDLAALAREHFLDVIDLVAREDMSVDTVFTDDDIEVKKS